MGQRLPMGRAFKKCAPRGGSPDPPISLFLPLKINSQLNFDSKLVLSLKNLFLKQFLLNCWVIERSKVWQNSLFFHVDSYFKEVSNLIFKIQSLQRLFMKVFKGVIVKIFESFCCKNAWKSQSYGALSNFLQVMTFRKLCSSHILILPRDISNIFLKA